MAKHDPLLDLLFAALADPTRREILAQLAMGDASVTELAAPHDMALPSFMKHLGKLEAAGLISSTKDGRVRSCALVPDAFAPMEVWLREQETVWRTRLDQFDAYVFNLMRKTEHGTGSED